MANISKKPKKKTIRARAKTGLAAAALKLDKGWEGFKYYIHYEVDKKECGNILKTYVKQNFDRQTQKVINANPEYKFNMYSHYAAILEWVRLGQPLDEKTQPYYDAVVRYMDVLKAEGEPLLKEKEEAEKEKSNVIVLTPQQRLWQKVNNTIVSELDELEDEWIEGKTTDFDMYNRMRFHDLKGGAIDIVRRRIEGWHSDYYDAYHKKCEQAVEGYSHLTRKEIKRRLDVVITMLADLDRLKDTAKTVRKARVKKPAAAEKQVAKMQYLKESQEYKLTSVNPLGVVGSMRLFVFNTKNKELTEYVSDNANGFSVKGTTLQSWDADLSRKIKLRKPDEFLPIALSKTPKQFDNEWKKLTTKEGQPNGRINNDCILVRVMDK
jgi:hypothetical protein